MENRRSKMTKKMIREALTELLETEELRKISVRMICEKADLNRSTFYLHYETLDDLLDEYTCEHMAYIWHSRSGVLSREDYRQTLEYIKAHPSPYKALLRSGLYHQFIMNEYSRLDFDSASSLKGVDRNAFMLLSAFTVPGIEQMILYILEHPEMPFSVDDIASVIYRLNRYSEKEIRQLSGR